MNIAVEQETKAKTEYYVGELINDIEFNYCASKDYQDLMRANDEDDRFRKFTKPQRDALNKLAPLVQKENIVYLSREELMSKLGINDKGNLVRFFKQIKHLVEYTSSHDDPAGVERGYVYIEVHPLYLWRNSLTKDRRTAVGDWFRFKSLSDCSKNDITIVPYYKSIHYSPKLFDKI